MTNRKAIIGAVAAATLVVLAGVAAMQARMVDRIAVGIRPGMSVADVLRHADGWALINTHPEGRGTGAGRTALGPEFNVHSGNVYVLAQVRPGGREAEPVEISRAELAQRLEALLSDGEPWTVYFSYRTLPTNRGVLVKFDGKGRVAQ